MNAAAVLAALGKQRLHAEDRAQQQVIDWAAFVRVASGRMLVRYIVAIPNGAHLAGDAKNRAMQMARLQRLGLHKGASDLLIAYPVGRYHGLFIEMKRPRDHFRDNASAERAVSDDQRIFLTSMADVGYFTAVCYGFDEAKTVTERYLRGS
jgi:hypothetical protein